MQTKRIIAGFAAAPLAPALLHGLVMRGLPGLLFALFFAIVLTLTVGVPAFLLFRKLGWLNVYATLLAGGVLGGLTGFAIGILSGFSFYVGPSAAMWLGLMVLYGTSAAATFWYVAALPKCSN